MRLIDEEDGVDDESRCEIEDKFTEVGEEHNSFEREVTDKNGALALVRLADFFDNRASALDEVACCNFLWQAPLGDLTDTFEVFTEILAGFAGTESCTSLALATGLEDSVVRLFNIS